MASSLSPVKRRATTVHGGRAAPRLAVAHTNPAVIDVQAGNVKQHKLTKLLLNVNIQNSLGPVHVVMSPENTVGDLVRAAIEIYVKEKRRPLLPSGDPLCYGVHYSQFSLDSLKTEEKVVNLGCRSFFLCPKPNNVVNSSCVDKAKAKSRSPLPLTKLMDFVL
ncbi:PREDICTED: uncharacterized protein LOC109212638 [Nicotiana attenuata]|uniref:DUF7054 domain-containing protein n=1 Tax=Nicotiana attenuata TaxID=49451 RepID=A0A1J6KGA8_NICAT|nr:PREDICTED: uncharacterized protein LOC109212638 [Nicotiana attenuata]OIT28438.1 hypothetical protein A4A49_33006 [Nicotiana attenuata]